MATTIWPSANDVGPIAGDGKNLLELRFRQLFQAFMSQNFVITGFTLPSSDADLTISIAAGSAVINGQLVDIDTATNATMTASTTNHIFLKIVEDGGGKANSASFEVNTSGTAPSNSVKIGTAVTSGTGVTSTTDARNFRFIQNSYIEDNSIQNRNMVDGAIHRAELQTSTVSLSGNITNIVGARVNIIMTGHMFFPMIHNTVDGSGRVSLSGLDTDQATPDLPGFAFITDAVSINIPTYDVDYRFVQP